MATSLLEKVLLILDSACSRFGNYGDMMFVVSTCLTYFLQEELELPVSTQSLAMVLTLECGAL